MSQPASTDIAPAAQLSRMIIGVWIPAAIHATAELGIADALANGPRHSDDLAREISADPMTLQRLLRAISVLELCNEIEPGVFALTPLGASLRTDAPDSVHAWALLIGGQHVWHCWSRLAECVRRGQPAPNLDGSDVYSDIAADPARAAVFNQAMTDLLQPSAQSLVAAYDFSEIRSLVDLGGGHGALLAAVLSAYRSMRGVVFDRPQCQDGAMRLLERHGVAPRAEFVSGNFFDSVPRGYDCYILKSCLQDWDDEHGRTILHTCRANMDAASRLLVIGRPAPEQIGTSAFDGLVAGVDLNMLVNTGGRERTKAEYQSLLENSGFRIARVVAPPSRLAIFDARPV